jgi:SAM-dependent methyltransferase
LRLRTYSGLGDDQEAFKNQRLGQIRLAPECGGSMSATDDRDLLREQRDYYAARASEYDDAYQRVGAYDRGTGSNADWHEEMARISQAFDALPLTGDIVELAAGTGYWTERLVDRARSLHVIDGSAATLAVNRARLGADSARVTYEVADLFEWTPPRTWDACVFGFWFCKVPDARVPAFLRAVTGSLRPGGIVYFVDKTAAAEPESEQTERTLNDGRTFTIVDHARPTARLVELFGAAGLDITVETFGSRFCLGHGIRP